MDGDQQPLGTTSCVILGLVGNRAGSGYDIAARVARSIAHFWPISKSQVYAELSRLDDGGFITGTHVEQDRRPDKRHYELTDEGAKALEAWVKAPGHPGERTRSGMLAKLFFAERMTPEMRVALLTDYRDEVDGYRRELQAVVDKLEGRDGSFYGRSTALYGVLTSQAKIDWADHLLAVLAGSEDLGEVGRDHASPTH